MIDRDCQVELERLAVAGGRLLVAVSGGRDSIVLLDVLRRCAPALDLELVIGHVNHGLRGEASEADEAHVRSVAAGAALPLHTARVAPDTERIDRSSRERPTLEEAARNLRRRALVAMADEAGCRWIATAHHAGDQAETLLLRILRGTGPDGLAGMAPQSADGRWLKPLLRVEPESIEAWSAERRLDWRDDASNRDRRFARNRLRHDVLPGLAATFNPRLLRSLSDLAEAERRDLEWIEGLVEQAAKERLEIEATSIRFAIDGWNDVPEALARRLVRRGLVAVGLARDVSRTHLERILGFLRDGRGVGRDKRLELPGGFVLRRVADGFELRSENARNGSDPDENARVPARD
jgi:tRNA(Ile)-lysidine synthase